jgi:hypothetical protein
MEILHGLAQRSVCFVLVFHSLVNESEVSDLVEVRKAAGELVVDRRSSLPEREGVYLGRPFCSRIDRMSLVYWLEELSSAVTSAEDRAAGHAEGEKSGRVDSREHHILRLVNQVLGFDQDRICDLRLPLRDLPIVSWAERSP